MGNPGRPEARRQPPFSALLVSLNHNPFALFDAMPEKTNPAGARFVATCRIGSVDLAAAQSECGNAEVET
jgi:hypothetical protein